MQSIKVEPVGIFGSLAIAASGMAALADVIPAQERALFAAYLRGGTIVLPIMEQTSDLIGGAFVVPGGSAIWTDGAYFWRGDTASYVEAHGVGLPLSFMETVRNRNYVCPAVPPPAASAIERYLVRHVFPTL